MLFGAMLPYMFAALTMISVGKAAAEIINEVRDQFHNRPDLVAADGVTTLRDCIIMASNGEPIPPEKDVVPDSNKCVEISTRSSVREMIAPGAYAILAPLFVGFLVGPRCLVGMLAGGICSGAMVAIMMSNAGGAWDNAKKYCEKDARYRAENRPSRRRSPAASRRDSRGYRAGDQGALQGEKRGRLAQVPAQEAALRRVRRRRHGRRPVQGHVGPRAQHPHQAHVHGVPDHRAAP